MRPFAASDFPRNPSVSRYQPPNRGLGEKCGLAAAYGIDAETGAPAAQLDPVLRLKPQHFGREPRVQNETVTLETAPASSRAAKRLV